MTKYGRSPWLDRYPASRVPSFPKYRGKTEADVAIVGGGLTGCMAAYAFAAAGAKVVLLEADRIGRGTTAFADGWISEEPGAAFLDVERIMGRKAARLGWQAWRRAALDFGTLVRRLDLKCDLQPTGLLRAALTSEAAQLMQQERKARQDAGLESSLLKPAAVLSEAGLSATLGLRSREGATLDPYRAAVGLAAAADARGAKLFERSTVRRTTFTRKIAVVHTADGSITVRRVVVATGTPTVLFKSLRRHFWFKSSYGVLTEKIPAKIRRTLGKRNAVLRDSASPPHTLRWMDDERLLVVGGDAATPVDRLKEKTIVQRTGQLMYELSTLYPDISGIQPEYGWESPYALTAEGLPYLGGHRNFPFHLFAFGDASHSVTSAYLASRMFVRNFLDQSDPADEAFTFTR